MSELKPLPTEDDYLKAIARVEERFVETGKGPQSTFISYGAGAPSLKSFSDDAFHLGSVVEPMDRFTQQFVDSQKRTAQAFHLGALAGLMVAREAHGNIIMPSKVFEALPAMFVSYADGDLAEGNHQITAQLISVGNEGLGLIGERVEERIKEWEMLSVGHEIHSRMFRVSCGLVMVAGRSIHEKLIQVHSREKEMEAFVASAHDFDWDAGLDSIRDR